MKKATSNSTFFRKLWLLLTILGPGFITASADNDAPGIATYSMAGSRYGYNFLWVLVAVTFGEVIVQEMAARMGTVTGKGMADLIREKFGVRTALFAMTCLLVANIGTTIAQFAGVAAGAELLGISRYIAIPVVGIGLSLMIMRGSYKVVEKILIILCMAALSYVVAAIALKPDWNEIARSAFIPKIVSLDSAYLLALLATIGTTITPWGIFYMQAAVVDKGVKVEEYPMTKVDVVFGAVWGNIISAFIIITTAATLFKNGIVVEEAEQAALALAPLAGEWAKVLFSIGFIGASILAATVLPLSTVYPIAEAFGWERGLDNSRKDAPIFYGLLAGVIIVSAIVVLFPNLPLFQLMWTSQALNAVLLPVILILMLKLANNEELLGKYVNKKWQNYFSYSLMVIICVATLVLFIDPWIAG
ncbi:MAG TPA: Nramp family divalent metal transporter [Anaerolineaceae bacterium]|jgi:NRAMP (natural resistance-associated macrophage protein)-like metal ion transporter|nr:Nramp family divalent metal transporter [Anaerolineaceae bacterium]